MDGANNIQGVVRYASRKIDKPYRRQTFAIKGETKNDKRKNVKSN